MAAIFMVAGLAIADKIEKKKEAKRQKKANDAARYAELHRSGNWRRSSLAPWRQSSRPPEPCSSGSVSARHGSRTGRHLALRTAMPQENRYGPDAPVLSDEDELHTASFAK